MARGGFVWTTNTLGPTLLIFDKLVDEIIEERLEEMAERIEAYMKENAPWEDESGAARDGLKAEQIENNIVLSHTEEYGIWLEVRWSGRWAIIIPTIEAMGPEVMAHLSGTLEEI